MAVCGVVPYAAIVRLFPSIVRSAHTGTIEGPLLHVYDVLHMCVCIAVEMCLYVCSSVCMRVRMYLCVVFLLFF